MSKHGYALGQKVIIKRPRRQGVEPQPIAAVVTKVGRVWGTATFEDPYPRERIFNLKTGVEKDTEMWQPVYIVTPEQAAEMDRIERRNRRLREARVYPYDSSLRLDEAFLEALDELVAKHLGKEADR
ncbi:hypothetical protein [Sanguibacter massiliensis]|uniref:beta barrel domain-containing protein n=1 Tax=Sanguibacter massiliensis TaxID=1973217 RepID=UPI000C8239D2|nr:hypothetical protein [Sanguibacter massiliensis]